MQAATPDVASVPAKLTVTGFRYQPFPSGGRSTEGETVGGVASYLNAKLAGALVFPAASLHVPVTATAAPSPPEYEGLEHDAIPDVASAPATATVSGCRYQAPESGGRDGVMAVTCGGVASRRTVIVLEYTSSGPYDTLQERCSVAVSSVTGRESQLTCVHPGSNCHEIATLDVCQLGHAAGPGEQVGIGAYGAAARAEGMRARASRASKSRIRGLKPCPP